MYRLFVIACSGLFFLCNWPSYTNQYQLPKAAKNNTGVRVLDCFLFFNEFDILDIRLHELYDEVDAFVLIEATRTFQNRDKPLYFSDNKERYSKFLDKIIHVVIDEYPDFPHLPVANQKNMQKQDSYDYFFVEHYQRGYIKTVLNALKLRGKDIIMITDVDEIINHHSIKNIRKYLGGEADIVVGDFKMFRFQLNRQTDNWQLPIGTTWGVFNRLIQSAQGFRNMMTHCSIKDFFLKNKKKDPNRFWKFALLPNLGWHFTSIGATIKDLHKKQKAYAHVCPLSTEKEVFQSIQNLKYCEINNSFPEYICDHIEELTRKGLIDTSVN